MSLYSKSTASDKQTYLNKITTSDKQKEILTIMKQYTLEQQKTFLINFALDNDFNTGERSFTTNLMRSLASSYSILDLFSEEVELLQDQDMTDKEIEELIENMLKAEY